MSWIEETRKDLEHNLSRYLELEGRPNVSEPLLDKFYANLLVNNKDTVGVPIEYVDVPTPSIMF